jgi:bacillopeptidase F (M6 metalloprotease family)
VEISADGGASWSQLALSPSYPGAFNDGSDGCGFASGTPSFTGTNLSWVQHSANLAPWEGQTVQLRFRYSTDSIGNFEGWYLDDFSLTHAQLPGLCLCLDGLFADGFESGGTGAWSLTLD